MPCTPTNDQQSDHVSVPRSAEKRIRRESAGLGIPRGRPRCRALREAESVARTRRPNRLRSLADGVDHNPDHSCNSTTAGLFIPQSTRVPVVHPGDRARGVKGRTWRTQSAKSPQTALQRSGARTMGCRSIPSRLATLLDGLRTAPRGSRRALASPDLRPPPARSRRRSPRRCALLGDGGSREWCEATSAASDGLAAQSHPLLPRSGRCGSSHRRLTTRLGRPARSGARRGECPSRSADTSWHRPQPLRPVN